MPPVPWAGRTLLIWLTGYSWQDNTPPGSAIVSHPILHQRAGGTGTFNDPITVASPGDSDTMAFPAGSRFYLPTVRRYVIVEDSGASPAPAGTDGHLDMWVDGQGGTKSASDAARTRSPAGRRPRSRTHPRACSWCRAPSLRAGPASSQTRARKGLDAPTNHHSARSLTGPVPAPTSQ
jgi:hypothetical protein